MNTTIQSHFDKLDELRAARDDQWADWRTLRQRWRDIAFAPDRVYDSATQTRLDDLDSQCDVIDRRIDELGAAVQRETDAMNSTFDRLTKEAALEQSRFRRPTGFWINLINRSLGPLPVDVERIVYDPTEFSQIPGRWILAVATLVTVATGAAVLSGVVPIAGSSPVSLAAGQDLASSIIFGIFTGLLIVGLVLQVSRKQPFKELVYSLALFEEQWFRQGSETWTRRRRVSSCVGFGIAHLANLIVAFATAGMLMLVGAVFMSVYLREMRRTGDQRRAVIASAKVHAHYNFVAFGLIIVGLVAYWMSLIFPLLS